MTRKQHFVPQFFLRRFANEKNGEFFTNVFDKVSKRRFTANVRDVATESYFYDLSSEVEGGHKSQLVETGLSAVEGEFQTLLTSSLESLDHGVFPRSHRGELAVFIYSTLLRTKAMRQSLVEAYGDMATSSAMVIASMLETNNEESTTSPQFAVDPKTVSNLHVSTMFDIDFIQKISSILCSHIWIAARNTGPRGFYASDNPVVLVPNIEGIRHPHTGVASPGIEIHFPLSSKYQLLILERNFFHSQESEENTVMELGEQFTVGCNTGQVRNCTRQVYSKDSNFFVARQYCTDHPDISTGQVK